MSKLNREERETLREAIHTRNEWEYGECDHGVYTGGASAGEPYAMCERMVAKSSIVVSAVQEIVDGRLARQKVADQVPVAPPLPGGSGTEIDEIDESTILIKSHSEGRLHGVWVRATEEPKPARPVSVADAQMQRLVEADRTEVVYPGGRALRVPRSQCRCPILTVGDFCPVHGG